MAKPALRFTVRRATVNDTSGVLDCLQSAFAPFKNNYTPEAYADTVLTPRMLADRLQTMSILVAVSESGDVIGTIAYSIADEGEGHLRGMAVAPDSQGAGVAGQLLQRAELELRARGCKRVTLDTTAPLHRAVAFYKKNGYRATGRVSDFFGMPLFEYAKLLGPP